jgi:hypothetical protein
MSLRKQETAMEGAHKEARLRSRAHINARVVAIVALMQVSCSKRLGTVSR